jgi:hypothetical protein
MKKTILILSIIFIAAQLLSAAPASALKGTVKNSAGKAISGAKVTLLKNKGTATTDSLGAFTISANVNVLQSRGSLAPQVHFSLAGNILDISPVFENMKGSVEIFSSIGRKNASILFNGCQVGNKTLQLPQLASGLNIIRVSIGSEIVTQSIVNFGNSNMYLKNDGSNLNTGNFALTKLAATAVVDTLVTTKSGYTDNKTAINSYAQQGVAIILDTAIAAPCTDPKLPANADLIANPKMPDPFKFLDGTKFTKKSQWPCRRAEMYAVAQQYLYGHMPPKPDSVWGTVSGGKITVNCKYKGKSVNFSVDAGSGTGDILVLSYGSGLPASPAGSRTVSKDFSMDNFLKNIQSLYGTVDAGLCMAGAWGVDRIIDVLEQNPTKGFDPKKVMVTGCSFAGKAALTSGAFCERVALTVAVESGACGAASWRAMKYFRGIDPDPCTNWQGNSESGDNNCKPQTIDHLESDWLGTVAKPFTSKTIDVDKLPLDQHFLIALCAPRPCLIVTNSEAWHWLCPKAETVSAGCAKAVYDALGLADHFGYVSATGYMHCGTTSIAHHVDACKEFYAKFYEGKNANTATYKGNTEIFKCNTGFCLDTAKWVDWKMDVTLE